MKGKEQSAGSGNKPEGKKKTPEEKAEESGEANCRCKAVAKKTPGELFKLMVSDLAFWKKRSEKKR